MNRFRYPTPFPVGARNREPTTESTAMQGERADHSCGAACGPDCGFAAGAFGLSGDFSAAGLDRGCLPAGFAGSGGLAVGGGFVAPEADLAALPAAVSAGVEPGSGGGGGTEGSRFAMMSAARKGSPSASSTGERNSILVTTRTSSNFSNCAAGRTRMERKVPEGVTVLTVPTGDRKSVV